MLSCFWLIQFCVLFGKDNADSVLLIQMFSGGSCLPGLPSLTFQCCVTNNLHVPFDVEGHGRLPTAREVGAVLNHRGVRAYHHSEITACPRLLSSQFCFLSCFFSSMFYSFIHSNAPLF